MHSINDSVDLILANFDGEVILPEDQHYDSACRIWNGAVEHHPALVIRPRSAEAVSRAVLCHSRCRCKRFSRNQRLLDERRIRSSHAGTGFGRR
jgi:hypothetical protein